MKQFDQKMEAGPTSSFMLTQTVGSKPQKKTLIVWSDSCGRQNKKQNYAITWYVGSKHFLKQKLSLPYHCFLDNDKTSGPLTKESTV